ncbi:MAG: hypothetical protein KGS73_10310, partial [Chloroflexi bacterium]|nr:hypothetical protein [Chloroflexota bacterium]
SWPGFMGPATHGRDSWGRPLMAGIHGAGHSWPGFMGPAIHGRDSWGRPLMAGLVPPHADHHPHT